MGLFDKLLKKVTDAAEKGVSNAISGSIRDAVKDVVSDAQEKLGIKEKDLEEDVSMYNRTPLLLVKEHKERVIPADDAVGSDIVNDGSTTTLMYFTDLIQKNLPEYTVTQSASIESVLGSAPEKNTDISLLLTKEGTPVLAIFLVPKNHYKPRKLIESMNALENAGIPAIRFINEFENKPAYVIGRIKTVIGA